MKFEIRNRFNGSILFSIETTSWKLAVEAAVTSSADLYAANLRAATLSSANLHAANLIFADLGSANLRFADLRAANLRAADLSFADLSFAKNANFAIASTRILPEGDIIGWKKCRDNVICKLLIPSAAKRSHAFGRKCRASRAKVLQVIGGKVGVSLQAVLKPIEYRKGKTVKPHEWCEDFTQECAGGIHFFITREEAESCTL